MAEPDCSNPVDNSAQKSSKVCGADAVSLVEDRDVDESKIRRLIESSDSKSRSVDQLASRPDADSEVKTQGSEGPSPDALDSAQSKVETRGTTSTGSKAQTAEEVVVLNGAGRDATNVLLSKNQNFQATFAKAPMKEQGSSDAASDSVLKSKVCGATIAATNAATLYPKFRRRRCRSMSKAENIVTEEERIRRAQPDKP